MAKRRSTKKKAKKAAALLQNRSVSRTEVLLGAFLALLIPAMSSGLALPQTAAMLLK